MGIAKAKVVYTMKKLLANLIGKKFSVYVGGEFERMTDFLGFIKLLSDYSDFFRLEKYEQYCYLEDGRTIKYFQVDDNIYVKLGK